MAKSSWTQSNFLGGEWSPMAQGRIDLPDYRAALATCVNAYPTEEGAWTRRGGTRMAGPTLEGDYGFFFPWDIASVGLYDVEISVNPSTPASHLRLWLGDQPVIDSSTTVSAVSTASPAVFTLASAQSWSSGDCVVLTIGSGTLTGTTQWAPIINRQCGISVIDSTHITLTDKVTGAPINGSGWTGLGLPTIFIGRIFQTNMPYTTQAQVFNICTIPTSIGGTEQMVFLAPGVQPYLMTLTGFSNGWPTVTVAAMVFEGPYQNLNLALTGTVSAASGSVTFTSTGALPNNGAGFASTDVGRSIRLYSQPAAFNPSTTYGVGDAVFWNGIAYQSLVASNTGNQPDQNPTKWAVAPQLIYWADALITAFTDTTHVTVNLAAFEAFSIPSQNGTTITTFTLGLYTFTGPAWPTCGTFHEGRLWLLGAIPNQLDGSETQLLTFRPTDINGNVNDDNAISYPLLSPKNDLALWALPDQQGILIGTQFEEWLVTASANNNILTPTSIQAHAQTTYGSFRHQPARAGMTIAFIQRYNIRIFEYIADVFSGRFSGLPLNQYAKQALESGASHVAYVENPDPILWFRSGVSSLSGCTYRRISRFVTEPPKFYGWHRHSLSGLAPYVQSICASQNTFGTSDALSLCTGTVPLPVSGSEAGSCYRQILQPILSEGQATFNAWHLDGAATGIGGGSPDAPNVFVGMVGIEDGTNMYFNGLWYQPGTVAAWLGGIYMGNFPVVNGAITVPYGSDPAGLGTRAYFVAIAAGVEPQTSDNLCNLQGLGNIPCVIGSNFTSMMTPLRPDTEAQTHTQTGPGAGLLKTVKQASALVRYAYNNSATISYDNGTSYPMVFRNYINGPATPNDASFEGVWRDTVEDDWTYDCQATINVTGPFPFVLNSFTPFQETSEPP